MTHEIPKDLKPILEKFNQKTAIPSIVLTAERSESTAITCLPAGTADSKLGGLPYLPKNYPYPKNSKNEMLKLLAQLNLSELPKLEHFPKEGILQFYVLPDDTIGSEETLINRDMSRVIYHKEILPPYEQMTDFPEVPLIKSNPDFDAWFPFEGEFLLKGKIESCPMTLQTYEFEPAFFKFYNENSTKPIDDLNKIRSFLWDKYNDEDFFKSQEDIHRVSGYPFFTQEDPRFYKEQMKKYDTLLLQINSQHNQHGGWDILWGDVGVAKFFINLEDLKNLNFQDTMYTWDCF